MTRTLLTAALGWLGINAALALTLAAHNAWTAHRTRRAARRRYTTEAICEARQRHPSASWLTLHNHGQATGAHHCADDCAGRLEQLYLAPAASVNR